MSYQITRGSDERPSIALADEPPFCVALDAAPTAREPELDRGWWLVMVFATWSAHDVAAIQTALDVAKHFCGDIKLGLRPFDLAEEHAAWCPTLGDERRSPLWLLLHDGDIRMSRGGLLTTDALIAGIEAARR
ncbi:MAG: hypothetical protein J0H14_13430 [Alphaproteobacteria bacterium]|nr:hypothetical protein [Alphaproteobacteria bacterium]